MSQTWQPCLARFCTCRTGGNPGPGREKAIWCVEPADSFGSDEILLPKLQGMKQCLFRMMTLSRDLLTGRGVPSRSDCGKKNREFEVFHPQCSSKPQDHFHPLPTQKDQTNRVTSQRSSQNHPKPLAVNQWKTSIAHVGMARRSLAKPKRPLTSRKMEMRT